MKDKPAFKIPTEEDYKRFDRMNEEKASRIRGMLNDLELAEKPLTDWESTFVDSISRQFAERGTLTEKQQTILTKIHTEKA